MLDCLLPVLQIAQGKGLQDNEQNQELKEKLDTILINRLAILRANAQDEVDFFMDDQMLSNKFKERVRNESSGEKMASVIIGRGIFFVADMVLKQPESTLGKLFVWWFEQAPACRSLAEWMGILLRAIINELCGEKLT